MESTRRLAGKSEQGDKEMRAIPKITVRIDRGEDWVERCGDFDEPCVPICGSGKQDWLDYSKFQAAWDLLNEAVME